MIIVIYSDIDVIAIVIQDKLKKLPEKEEQNQAPPAKVRIGRRRPGTCSGPEHRDNRNGGP